MTSIGTCRRDISSAFWTAQVDREELRVEVLRLATDFAIHCVREAPGVTKIGFSDLVSTAQRDPDWVSLWAAEPGEVQQRLLDMLAPIELQLDQFHFERGETPPRR